MRTASVAFVLAALVAVVLTPLVRGLARRWGALDHALSSRKVHGRPVPRLGGIAIVAAFLAPVLALYVVDSDVGRQLWNGRRATGALVLGGLAIAALGVVDDLRGLGAKGKFTVQFGVAAFMYALGYRVNDVAIPFGPVLHLGWAGLPFTMLWIAGVVNAMNLIDGLDGLAAGVGLVAVLTTLATSALAGQALMVLFAAALAGALAGFLLYNFNPATIFMGDSGSMFIGFVLATTAIRTAEKSTAAVALAVPLLALGVPISDTLLAMGRRALRGVPLFSADRGHIHHRLLDRGLSHRDAVLVIYGGATLLGLAAVALSVATSVQAALVLLVAGGLALAALRALGFLSFGKVAAALVDRRRNLDRRGAVRRAGELLRRARTAEEIWEAVRSAAPAVGASAVGLTLGRLAGRPDAGPWEDGFDDAPAELLRARYGLAVERPGDDHVEFGWIDGRAAVDRDTEIAIELLCELASGAVDRVERAETVIRLTSLDDRALAGRSARSKI